MFAEKMIYLLPQTLISIIINITLNILLIPAYGAVGAAFATAISQLCVAIVVYYLAQKAYHLPISFSKTMKLYIVLLILSFLVYLVMVSDLSVITKLLLKSAIVSLYFFYGFRNKMVSSKQLKGIFQNIRYGS